MSDNDQIRNRALQAQRELSETEAAFDAMKANAIAAWAASKDSETVYREGLYRAVNVIDAVREHLRQLVEDGQVADFADALRAETQPA